ncbi:Predicted arabinose efflux permease, MFS family [Halorientalis persicus]|uniref:Predicted arabinose efflux permease, MFS family n=1 Tax=Halorientalis persicus TaxID=1367881 RepID=A0A1H8PE46_9EURY|nr:MFS transporter [Halorientalis persicus]SEO40071.1 Predicted arabinose efflux permease, MFS family [Halorientalis persicus]
MSRRYASVVLALCTLAFFATMVARLVISPVVPNLTLAFGVSNGTIGLALSGMWVAYATTQFPSGVLGDRFGERKIILTAVGGTAVTSLLLTTAPNFPLFFLGTVLLGAVAGLHYSVATTLLARYFDDIGWAIGVHVAGGPLAGLLAPIAAAVVATQYGWRPAIGIGAAVAVPVFVAFALAVESTEPRRPDQPMRERFEIGAVRELLSRPQIRYTTALSVLGAFSWQATASFLPTFLSAHHDLSTTTAGALFSVYFVIHGLTQPLLGSLSDRLSRDGVVAGALAMAAVGYAVLVLTEQFAVVIAGCVLVGVGMSWGAPLQSRFMDILSDAERGAGFGLVRSVYMTIGASGSVVVGVLSDTVGWTVAFGLLAVLVSAAVVAIVVNRMLGLGL